MSTILIAEDEEVLRQELADVLGKQGYRVLTAPDGASALSELKKNSVQLVLSDMRMPRMEGLELLREGSAAAPEAQFVIMTAFGSMETAIEALRAGAADYLIKPVSVREVLLKVNRLMENAELHAVNRMLKRDVDRSVGPLEMVGKSAALEQVRSLINKVSGARSPLLITGESGTGKELVARAIHALGSAKGEPFVAINCAAIPEHLLESELFGHQRGAFTGAVTDSEGLFRAARKGTLFLDEVGELPMSLQAKLLRVIEDRMIQPVGSTKPVAFEGRVLVATHRDLRTEIDEKRFREDLYFRLAIVEIRLPALRQRTEDIPLLAANFIRKLNRELNRNFTGIDDECARLLLSQPWRGNIRELRNCIERAMLIGQEPLLRGCDVVTPAMMAVTAPDSNKLKDAVRAFEHAHVQRVLSLNEGDKKAAAAELDISISSLYRYLDNKPPADTTPNP